MRTFIIKDLEVVRAGSDYIPGVWSINVVDTPALKGELHSNETVNLQRTDGTTFRVRVDSREVLDGQPTILLIDEEYC